MSTKVKAANPPVTKAGKNKVVSQAPDRKEKPESPPKRQLGALRHLAEVSDHLFDDDLYHT